MLFYAVECGAKAAYAKQNRVDNDAWLTEEYTKKIGHRLNRALQNLGISLTIPDVRSTAAENGNALIPSKCLHEAWRYGRPLEDSGKNEATEKLEEALEKVNELLMEMR